MFDPVSLLALAGAIKRIQTPQTAARAFFLVAASARLHAGVLVRFRLEDPGQCATHEGRGRVHGHQAAV